MMEFDYPFKGRPLDEYGTAVPFLSINNTVKEDSFSHLLDKMQKGGHGGYFFHAREGYPVEDYLEDEWWKGARFAYEEGMKRNIRFWMYDEFKWPSGFAGGKVPRTDPELRNRALVYHEEGVRPEFDEVETIRDYGIRRRISHHVFPMGDDWFEGTAYVDLMNPKTTELFLKITHDRYREFFSDEEWKTVPAMFTDEPCYLMWCDVKAPCVPWTPGMLELYKNRWDEELDVESLFLLRKDPADMFARVRFYRLATDLFVDSFFKQTFDWCEANGTRLTGHLMCEQSLLGQVRWIGAAMTPYAYMHVPGTDHLGDQVDETITHLQCQSAAEQFSRPVLCECFGASGQDRTTRDYVWIGSHLYVHGISIINEHLLGYDIKGRRKRDHPPDVSWRQPWFDGHMPYLTDLWNRAGNAGMTGQQVVEYAVLHPMTSAWAVYSPFNEERIRTLDDMLEKLVKTLEDRKVPFHFIDEGIMERFGEATPEGLKVKDRVYTKILVPPVATVWKETSELLDSLGDNVSITRLEVPETEGLWRGVTDGPTDPAWYTSAPVIGWDGIGSDSPLMSGSPFLRCQLRASDEGKVLMVNNPDRERSGICQPSISGVKAWHVVAPPGNGIIVKGDVELVVPPGSTLILFETEREHTVNGDGPLSFVWTGSGVNLRVLPSERTMVSNVKLTSIVSSIGLHTGSLTICDDDLGEMDVPTAVKKIQEMKAPFTMAYPFTTENDLSIDVRVEPGGNPTVVLDDVELFTQERDEDGRLLFKPDVPAGPHILKVSCTKGEDAGEAPVLTGSFAVKTPLWQKGPVLAKAGDSGDISDLRTFGIGTPPEHVTFEVIRPEGATTLVWEPTGPSGYSISDCGDVVHIHPTCDAVSIPGDGPVTFTLHGTIRPMTGPWWPAREGIFVGPRDFGVPSEADGKPANAWGTKGLAWVK